MPRECGIQIPKLSRCDHNRAGVVKLRPENPALSYLLRATRSRARAARERDLLAVLIGLGGLSRDAHPTQFGCVGGGKIEAGGKGEFLGGVIGLVELCESLAAAQMQVAPVRRRIVRGIKFGDGPTDIAQRALRDASPLAEFSSQSCLTARHCRICDARGALGIFSEYIQRPDQFVRAVKRRYVQYRSDGMIVTCPAPCRSLRRKPLPYRNRHPS